MTDNTPRQDPSTDGARYPAAPTAIHDRGFQFSEPAASDGADIYRLVRNGGTLELNSAYAYMLAGAHFGATSVIARDGAALCGFVWGYRPPTHPDTLFVWQIGVARDYRGAGLGHALLAEALSRPACRDVRYLEATVTPSNEASMALFKGFGHRHDSPVTISTAFDTDLFPDPAHETEMLVRVGPFKTGFPPR